MVSFLESSGLKSLADRVAGFEVRGGASIRHSLFAALVFCLIAQCTLGILLSTYYSPSATDAWASTAYLNDQVSAGWMLRGLHYHLTSVMLVVAALHVGSIALMGGYRRPREFFWFASLLILVMIMAAGVSGNILPWDEEGYWSGQVELSIVEQSPMGGMIRTLIEGGSQAGNLTLTRIFTAHAFVLPGVMGLLLAVMFGVLRNFGNPSSADAEGNEPAKKEPYFPRQFFFDGLAVFGVALTGLALTLATHGSDLFGPADPTSNFQARPEWYFLPLFKLRMWFEGPLEPVATLVLPGIIGGVLFAAPFIGKTKGGRLAVLGVLAAVGLGATGLGALSIVEDKNNESLQESMEVAELQAERAREFAKEGTLPAGGPAVFENDPDFKVIKLFEEHCQNCHKIGGLGGEEAPDLTDYGSRAWRTALIRNPNDARYFGNTKHDLMDAYDEESVPADQMEATVEYLVSLVSEPAFELDAALVAKGKGLWDDELECSSCHEVEAGASSDGPTLFDHGSTAWVERVIRDDSAPDLFGEDASMPKFNDKLTDEEIHALALFITQRPDPAP